MMTRNLSSFLLYSTGFLLLWEWLRPIEQLTHTDQIEVFIVFLLFSFLASFLHMKRIWRTSIKIVFILLTIYFFYYGDEFFHFRWLKDLVLDLIENSKLLFGRHWIEFSDEFRTLLFFILLWLMVYLIHYWLIKRRQIFMFFLMTLIYITVLDTFTPYSAKTAIVRTIVCGFIVMGILTFNRIISMENMNKQPSFPRKWILSLAAMLTISIVAGFALPKAAPIWPDPVPYLQAATNRDSANGITNTLGYRSNDSRLGGPFIGNDKVVFQAEAEGSHYWKIETRDMYTGKGWITLGDRLIPFGEDETFPIDPIPNTIEKTEVTASLSLYIDYPFLLYPAGIKEVSSTKDFTFKFDTAKDKIYTFNEQNDPDTLSRYTVSYDIPRYKASDLVMSTEMTGPEPWKESYSIRYTQLPESLPPRIQSLAEQITAGKTNWFDKAKAIEGYFSNSEFTYDQKNIPYPGSNEDYVDQFLFTTKRGYCDNFSTSMVVMLRTLGIPSRWVKGFTGGDFVRYSDNSSNKQLYEITNNNAHSWVEVFFPNQGWVPFEPTKGFENNTDISYTSNAASSNSQTASSPPEEEKPKKPLEEAKKNPSSNDAVNGNVNWIKIKGFIQNNWIKIVLFFVIIGGAAALLYRIRGKWFPYYLLLRYRYDKKDESMSTAYLLLLKQLDRYGLKRKENQTLRNYAKYVDTFFSTREMTQLTLYYEQWMYHQSLPKGSWFELKELWENLIKKTIA